MREQAIYNLYPSVTHTIDGIPFDSNGNEVTIDDVSVQAEAAKLSADKVHYTVITKLQLKKYLMGLTPERWTELKTLLSADANMKEDWDLTTQLDITDPSVVAIASVMNMTLKDVFNAAGKL